jgi:hypothetical protein
MTLGRHPSFRSTDDLSPSEKCTVYMHNDSCDGKKIMKLDKQELLVVLSLVISAVLLSGADTLAPEAVAEDASPEPAKTGLNSTITIPIGHNRFSIAAWVAIAFIALLIIIFVLTIVFKGRNTQGLPNTIRGEIVKVSGLSTTVDPYVVVSSMGEMCHRTSFKLRPGETAQFNELFAWSVAPYEITRFKQAGKVKFEVFNMKEVGYSVMDPSLGAVEIPISELYVEGQVEKLEGLRLRTKKGVVINVKVGIFAEHFFFQSFNRFLQSWRLRQREVSFWARVLSIILSTFLIFSGLIYLETPNCRSIGVTDVCVGAIIGAILVPHVLHWIGSTFLDILKLDSLLSTASIYLTCASVMGGVWRYLGPSDPLEVAGHFGLIGCVGFGALLFFIGDLRGEPGASCLGRALGGAFSTIFGCCCGSSSKAALLRHVV